MQQRHQPHFSLEEETTLDTRDRNGSVDSSGQKSEKIHFYGHSAANALMLKSSNGLLAFLLARLPACLPQIKLFCETHHHQQLIALPSTLVTSTTISTIIVIVPIDLPDASVARLLLFFGCCLLLFCNSSLETTCWRKSIGKDFYSILFSTRRNSRR